MGAVRLAETLLYMLVDENGHHITDIRILGPKLKKPITGTKQSPGKVAAPLCSTSLPPHVSERGKTAKTGRLHTFASTNSDLDPTQHQPKLSSKERLIKLSQSTPEKLSKTLGPVPIDGKEFDLSEYPRF